MVGAVEEVFGPILSPLYAFRWAGRGQQAAEVAPGARVFTTARLAHYVVEESLQAKVSAHCGGRQLAAAFGLGLVSASMVQTCGVDACPLQKQAGKTWPPALHSLCA